MSQVAFVMLGPDASPVTPGMLAEAWRRLWPNEEPLELPSGNDGSMEFSFMGVTGVIGYMPVPLPWAELEELADSAWHWPEAVTVLKSHQCHVVVGVIGEETAPRGRSMRLTWLTAAVCAAMPSAVAVYWGSGASVSSADKFVQLAQEMTEDTLPLLAWVGFRIVPNDTGTRWSVFTTGLKALGVMEIEVRDAKGEPLDVVDKVLELAGLVASSDLILRDGATIGTDRKESLRIHHVPSTWHRDETVLWVEMK